MIKQRVPKTEKDLRIVEGEFIQSVDKTSLSDLTLDELVNRYNQIDYQSHIMKGLILLEARSRFPSNNEFGDWIQSVQSICLDSQPVRTRLMNFAGYFKDKDTTGISLSACYEISAPINADIADKVYQAALNKNLSVAQIKAEIAKAKGLLPESIKASGEPELMPFEDLETFKQVVLLDVKELSSHNALKVLKDCIKEIQKNG
jgi:hypothetical protein